MQKCTKYQRYPKRCRDIQNIVSIQTDSRKVYLLILYFCGHVLLLSIIITSVLMACNEQTHFCNQENFL